MLLLSIVAPLLSVSKRKPCLKERKKRKKEMRKGGNEKGNKGREEGREGRCGKVQEGAGREGGRGR